MAKKTTPKMEDLITQAEAAKLRGVSLASINELVQRGRLRVVELFGRKLLKRADLEAFRKLKTGPKAGRSPVRKRTRLAKRRRRRNNACSQTTSQTVLQAPGKREANKKANRKQVKRRQRAD